MVINFILLLLNSLTKLYALAGNRGPYHIWEKDSEEDKKHWNQIIEEENEKRAYRMAENQVLAHEKGTWQKQALDEFNQRVDEINASEKRTGRHKKRKRKPEDMFREGKVTFTSKDKFLAHTSTAVTGTGYWFRVSSIV